MYPYCPVCNYGTFSYRRVSVSLARSHSLTSRTHVVGEISAPFLPRIRRYKRWQHACKTDRLLTTTGTEQPECV